MHSTRLSHITVFLLVLILVDQVAAVCLDPQLDKSMRKVDSFQHLTYSSDGFFCLYWNSQGDSLFPEEHVNLILEALVQARDVYHGLPGGWQIPTGPEGHFPVFLVPQNVPGATAPPQDEAGGATYMLLDTDMSRFGGDPEKLYEVTAAHELFHAYQIARGFAWQNLAFYEASAVWAEDLVFPDHDDWATRYLPGLLERLDEGLTETGGSREYGLGALVGFGNISAGSWAPCRDALDQSHQHDAWQSFLGALDDPAGTMHSCLLELLFCGDAAQDYTLTEFALVSPPDRAGFPLLENAVIENQVLAETSWSALSVSRSGQLAGVPFTDWLACGGDGERLLPLGIETSTLLRAGDWVLAANPGAGPFRVFEGASWQSMSLSGNVLVWPNPGGNVRTIQFLEAPEPLQIYGLDGSRMGSWYPQGDSRTQLLTLPAIANGPLYLRGVHGGVEARLLLIK